VIDGGSELVSEEAYVKVKKCVHKCVRDGALVKV
jgi:hypothetical protein